MRKDTEAEVAALQEALAGEHAAVWVYGVLGGQSSRSRTPSLFREVDAAYGAHRGRRDLLERTVRDLGADPVASEVAYELPNPVANPRQVEAAFTSKTRAVIPVHLGLVAGALDRHRRHGVDRDSGPPARAPGEPRDLPRSRRAGGPLNPDPAITGPRVPPPGQQQAGATRSAGPSPAGNDHSLHGPAIPSGFGCRFSRCTNLQKLVSGTCPGHDQERTTPCTSDSRCTTASGVPSVCPTWPAGMVLCGTWIARSPADCAPYTSSKRRSPT